jgi:ubiquinone biosynthesis protein
MERWMREQVGPSAFARKMKKNLPQLAEQAPDLPLLAHKVLEDAAAGKLELVWKSPDMQQLREEMRQAQRRSVGAISGGSLVIAAALLMSVSASSLLAPATAKALAVLLGSTGGLLLLRAWWRA